MHDDQVFDVRPWEQPSACRRDCEPHRGEFLSLLANASVVMSCIGFVSLGAAAVVGLPLGLVVMLVARHDLRQMKAGQMDLQGYELTNNAWILGCLGSLIGLAALSLALFVWWVWNSQWSWGGAMGLAAL